MLVTNGKTIVNGTEVLEERMWDLMATMYKEEKEKEKQNKTIHCFIYSGKKDYYMPTGSSLSEPAASNYGSEHNSG